MRTLNGMTRVVLSVVLASVACPAIAFAGSAQRIAAGKEFSCAVTTSGGVLCWGANSKGQVGDGTTNERPTPTPVIGMASNVAAVTAGESHACAIISAGAVRCWGANSQGQLGDGTVTDRPTPAVVTGLTTGASSVSGGLAHTCAVVSGAVKCWGDNYFGQLGDGTTSRSILPVDVVGLGAGAVAVAATDYHTCALMASGGVKCWGRNAFGQLGDGTTTSRLTPVDVSDLTTATSLTIGYSHGCVRTATGGVRCWGGNSFGQLGDGTTTGRLVPVDVVGLTGVVASVGAGHYHTCAVTVSGATLCWGMNNEGELGDGSSDRRLTPVPVSGSAAGGANVAGGYTHTCATTAGGGIRCWGANNAGQLGHGTTTTRMTPVDVPGLTSGGARVAVGLWHTCAVTTAGGVRCWGSNWAGQLGDGTTSVRVVPSDVSVSDVVSVAAKGMHTCVLTSGGGLKCWGMNSGGELGDGTTTSRSTPVDVRGFSTGAVSLTAGEYHTCGLTASGGVKCWGSNGNGRLGDGSTTDRLEPVDVSGLTAGVAAVSAGSGHTCAVTVSGGLKCWGSNSSGQLGDGTTVDRLTPVDVTGLTSGVTAVAAGSSNTCALLTGGGVKCWGQGAYGVGDGTLFSRPTPVNVTGLGSGVTSISAGAQTGCAVTTEGALKCWGANVTGQLGNSTKVGATSPGTVSGLASGVAFVAAGSYVACVVTTGGGVKCWGDDRVGQVGDLTELPPLTPVRTLSFGRPDFDGDDKVDVAVYRPSSGTWFSLDSTANNTTWRYRGWGVQAENDTPVTGDFDGDGILDPAVYRPSSGTWFILESRTAYATWNWFGWGEASDSLVPGDYDGDGRTDAAVYRASTGTWYVRPSSGAPAWTLAFGSPGDVVVAGDFDGDGRRDPAVYRPSAGTWFWLKSSTNFTTFDYRGWGVEASGDTPAPGDYDGDGKTDPCVFRPGTGSWFVLESGSGYGSWSYFGWGASGDTLVPADYDGDGRTDAAIYRAGTWYVRPSSGAAQWTAAFGDPGDLPLVVIR
jgi:alpha-tubulin suppressor-like RCC1 family protein